MNRLVDKCPITKFDGELLRLNETEGAVDWLKTVAKKALALTK